MSRGDQIQRQWNLLKLLQTRGTGVPLRELATEFEVSERTIQRDFELLQELGFPIEHQEDEFGKRYWRMPHDFMRSGPLVLSLTEAVSLHLAREFFEPLAGTLFYEGMSSVLGKIRALLPQRALGHFQSLDQTLHIRRIGATDYREYGPTVRALTEAIRERRTTELEYRSIWRGEEYTMQLDAYGLIYFEGDLFVVGRSHRADAVRVLKINRITAARPTEARFERPVGFSLEAHFRSTFGIVQSRGKPVEVTVRFSGPAAVLVEERLWHETQRVERSSHGPTLFAESAAEADAVLATFRLSNLIELKRWLRGFGADAEVLRPAWLREEMRAELLNAAHRYG